jgi:N-acetylglucosaminyl-diphospho-decaprenol L-rhamnosyltransferase
MLLNSDRSIQPSVRSFPTLGVFIWFFFKLHHLAPQVSWWRHYIRPDFNYTQEQFVDQVMGAAFLIRAEARRELGVLDDRFWLWFEEVEFCKRAHAAGWKTIYTPSAQILHHGATSFNQLVGFKKVVPFLLSALQYARLHLSEWQWGLLMILFPFAVLLSFPAALVHVRGKQKNKVRL